jgi:DNA-binding GntR family transcriptional regulator
MTKHSETGDIRRTRLHDSPGPSGSTIICGEIITQATRPIGTNPESLDVDAHRTVGPYMNGAAESREVYALRSMLEPRAMAEVASLPEGDRSTACDIATELVDRMKNESDVAAWTDLNREFYGRLMHPLRTTRPLLCRLMHLLCDRSTPTASGFHVQPAFAAQADRNYRDLVAAIREGDADLATRTMARHVNWAMQVALQSHCESN